MIRPSEVLERRGALADPGAISDGDYLFRPLASFRDEVSGPAWEKLTHLDAKRDHFSIDPYFREAWRDFNASFGAMATDALEGLAFLVLRPDAIVARKAHIALDYMESAGFTPLVALPFRYTQWSCREGWRYMCNQLSVDRISLNERLLTSGNSILVAFRDRPGTPRLPASVRMQSLKGDSMPDQQKAHQLRAVLKGATRFLKFIHVSDEPADLIREAGLLFTRSMRLDLFAEIRRNWDDQVSERVRYLIDREYAVVESHSLEAEAVWEHLSAMLIERGHAEAMRLHAQLLKLCDGDGAHEPEFWLSVGAFEEGLRRCGIQLKLWDFLTLAGRFAFHRYLGDEAVIEGDGYAAWLRLGS